MVQPIPKPQLLDPHRPIHEDRGDSVEHALSESCAYANMLWDNLDTVRHYLLASLPTDPHAPGAETRTSASPTGPGDDEGWHQWMRTFADVTSVLCGPHGDSGFGLERAAEEAQHRRTSPAATAAWAGNAENDPNTAPTVHADPPIPAPQPRAAQDSTTASPQHTAPQHEARGDRHLPRPDGLAVLIGLAVRGLRPRHSRIGAGRRQ